MEIPIVKVSDNKFKVAVNATIYAKEAIAAACYKFTGNYYVFEQQSAENNYIDVVFESKDDTLVTEVIVKEFCNELIDQQVRINTNQQFGRIRDLIVEEAFKPVSK